MAANDPRRVTSAREATTTASNPAGRGIASWPSVLVAAGGPLVAWWAAGSLGLVDAPLTRVGTGIGVVLLSMPFWRALSGWSWQALVLALLWLTPFVLPVTGFHGLLLVVGTMALLTGLAKGPDRIPLRISSSAILCFAGYRWLCETTGLVWWLSDRLGGVFGTAFGALAEKPLRVGVTFSGIDLLILMLCLILLWTREFQGARPRYVIAASLAVLGIHTCYLLTLAHAADLAARLPQPAVPEAVHPYVPPDWDWAAAAAQWFPWNLPLLPGLLYTGLALLMFRWTTWPRRSLSPNTTISRAVRRLQATLGQRNATVAALLAAACLSVLSWPSASGDVLPGKRILAVAGDDLDWDLPEHGRYGQASAGTFGMLPRLVQSLGAELQKTTELTTAELASADCVLLLRTAGSLTAPQTQRLLDYVRRGGAVLLVDRRIGAATGESDLSSGFLAPTKMHLRRDRATSTTGGWAASLQSAWWPGTLSMLEQRGSVFGDLGASLELGWPARPLVVGRWGWSDPGEASPSSPSRYEPGERLGDLVLAAEQRIGRGTVLVIGDETAFTNEGLVHGCTLVERLLTDAIDPPWRSTRSGITIGLLILLIAWLVVCWLPSRWLLACLTWSVIGAWGNGWMAPELAIPRRQPSTDGAEELSPVRLAYLDASHLESYRDADWVFDGVNGLALNLMRSGYLTLRLKDWTDERLRAADVIVTIAPGRRFSRYEQRLLRDYIEDGGTWIVCAGAEDASTLPRLLADAGITVPHSPVATRDPSYEPEPMGRVRAACLDAADQGLPDRRAFVQFHAAWPLLTDGEDVEVLVRATADRPVVAARQLGQGELVVIADSHFALNKNLEYVGGEPFDGGYENADFWRWLLSRLQTGREEIPPDPSAVEAGSPAGAPAS